MGADGLAAQRQLLGNVVDVRPLGQALKHRKLALGQQRVQRPLIRQPHLKHHAICQLRVDIAPARGHLANGGQQQCRVAVFGGIARRAKLQGTGRHLRFVVHRQHQNNRRVVQRTNPRDGLQPIHPRHGDIQQHHFTRHMAQGFKQLLAIARLAHHQQVFRQADQLLDAFTHDGVIFCYQYTNHRSFLIQSHLGLAGVESMARAPPG